MMNVMLTIAPDAGLGNRMYGILSALYYQKKYGINIKLVWEINMGCGIKMDELFEKNDSLAVNTIYRYPISEGKIFRSAWGKLVHARQMKNRNYFSSAEIDRIFQEGGEEEILKIFEQRKKILFRGNTYFTSLDNISNIADELKPSKEIANRVEEIFQPYANKRIIGIHIRRTDNEVCILHSPTELFVAKMKEYVEEDSNTVFFLATDDETIREELGREYQLIERRPFSTNVERKSAMGMKDALVDMLCLSKCQAIVGSYASTFSKMAALIGKIDCEMIYK